MNENVSVISECDNLEIENYLKSCGSYLKNTEVKFVENHDGGGRSSEDVGNLIQYSKCALEKFRTDLRENETLDIDKHIIIEKKRLNELLKMKIKEYLRNHPEKSPEKQCQQPSKVVHFKEKPKPKPLVRNVRRIKTIDRHTHCTGNKNPSKPGFVSRKSQQIHENKLKSLRIGRNIIVDPNPVSSFYPRRIFNDTKPESQESYRPTWHNRLMMHTSVTDSNCTIVSTTLTSQVIKKSEIKVLRYNFDWGGTDAIPHETTDGKKIQNIDQTTQTENNVVTTKSVECYTEQFFEINKPTEIPDQSAIIEPSIVQVSSHETDENVQLTVGSSFVYEYESTFDESSSDSELSETVKPTMKSDLLQPSVLQPKKTNILLESVVYEDRKSDHRDAVIQTDFEPIKEETRNSINNQILSSGDEESSQNIIEQEIARLDDEIMQDKFKLLSVLRQSSRDTILGTNATQLSAKNVSQPSDLQLQLTPFKPRQASEFMPSPLELSSIRPLSLTHKNAQFDLSNEKCWKTINKIQMDAARKPFSPKTETDDVAKRAAEKFLKSTVINTNRAVDPEPTNSTTLSSCVSNVMIITSSSEYDSDSTVTSHRYALLKQRFTNSDKISEGEVLSLGEVRKFTDDSE